MPELRRRNVRIDLPPGWDGEIYPRSAPPGTLGAATRQELATLHAATFPLPRGRGDFGSGAVELMGSGDLLVVLFEHEPASAGTPLFAHRGIPLPLDPDQFHPQALQRPLPGQAGLQHFFSIQDRAFCLYVAVGSFRLRSRLVGMANSTLAGLRIDRLGG